MTDSFRMPQYPHSLGMESEGKKAQKHLHSLSEKSPRTQMLRSMQSQANRPLSYDSVVGDALYRKRHPHRNYQPKDGPPRAQTGAHTFSVPSRTPSDPVLAGIGKGVIKNHEHEHAFQQTPKDSLREIGPSIGDLVFMGEQFAKEQGKPLNHQVNLPGGKTHDINWMREMATKHGYWDGRPMSDLIFNTQEGRQWLEQMSGQQQPTNQPAPELSANTADIQRRQTGGNSMSFNPGTRGFIAQNQKRLKQMQGPNSDRVKPKMPDLASPSWMSKPRQTPAQQQSVFSGKSYTENYNEMMKRMGQGGLNTLPNPMSGQGVQKMSFSPQQGQPPSGSGNLGALPVSPGSYGANMQDQMRTESNWGMPVPLRSEALGEPQPTTPPAPAPAAPEQSEEEQIREVFGVPDQQPSQPAAPAPAPAPAPNAGSPAAGANTAPPEDIPLPLPPEFLEKQREYREKVRAKLDAMPPEERAKLQASIERERQLAEAEAKARAEVREALGGPFGPLPDDQRTPEMIAEEERLREEARNRINTQDIAGLKSYTDSLNKEAERKAARNAEGERILKGEYDNPNAPIVNVYSPLGSQDAANLTALGNREKAEREAAMARREEEVGNYYDQRNENLQGLGRLGDQGSALKPSDYSSYRSRYDAEIGDENYMSEEEFYKSQGVKAERSLKDLSNLYRNYVKGGGRMNQRQFYAANEDMLTESAKKQIMKNYGLDVFETPYSEEDAAEINSIAAGGLEARQDEQTLDKASRASALQTLSQTDEALMADARAKGFNPQAALAARNQQQRIDDLLRNGYSISMGPRGLEINADAAARVRAAEIEAESRKDPNIKDADPQDIQGLLEFKNAALATGRELYNTVLDQTEGTPEEKHAAAMQALDSHLKRAADDYNMFATAIPGATPITAADLDLGISGPPEEKVRDVSNIYMGGMTDFNAWTSDAQFVDQSLADSGVTQPTGEQWREAARESTDIQFKPANLNQIKKALDSITQPTFEELDLIAARSGFTLDAGSIMDEIEKNKNFVGISGWWDPGYSESGQRRIMALLERIGPQMQGWDQDRFEALKQSEGAN